MAEGHCATVDVDARSIETEFLHQSDGLYREGLVEFVEIDIVGVPAGLGEDLADGIDGRHHYPLGSDPAGGLGDDPCHRLET